MKYYIFSHPDTYWVLPIFFHQWSKYRYSDYFEPVVLCYQYPDVKYQWADYISMGSPGGASRWCEDIREVIKEADQKFVFSLDDFIPIHPVNERNLELSYKLEYDKFNLFKTPREYRTHHIRDDLYKYYDNTPYRISTQVSVWKRDYMLQFLKDGWSPWDFEVEGSKLSKGNGDIYTTAEGVVYYNGHGCVSRRYQRKFNGLGFKQEDLEEFISCGWLKPEEIQIRNTAYEDIRDDYTLANIIKNVPVDNRLNVIHDYGRFYS
jgi:hypothetical protein